MARPTINDVAVYNPLVRTEMIDEATRPNPELTVLPWKKVPGYTYQTKVKTANPVAPFRVFGSGAAAVTGTHANRTVTCYPLNPRWECDKMEADACVDGAELYIADAGMDMLQGAFTTFATQIYYGVTADAAGFPGLQSLVASANTINASGTTAATASSIYIVAADRVDNIALVLGGNGNFGLSDVRVETVYDSSSNPLTAYVQEVEALSGLQLGHSLCVVRICNVTDDSGKGTTDALLSLGVEKMEELGLSPTDIFMNSHCKGQLQRSRTATTPTGAYAAWPTDHNGIPIHTSRVLTKTEAIVSFTS